MRDKKVLRENKRHTARRVTSTCYAVLVGGNPPSWPGTWPDLGSHPVPLGYPPFWPGTWSTGGNPIQSWVGECPRVPPILILDGGTTHPDLGWGYPPFPDLGYGYPLSERMEVPPPIEKMGYPPPPSARWGYPLWNVNRQTPVEIVPSPFLRNAGGKNSECRRMNSKKTGCCLNLASEPDRGPRRISCHF